MDANEYARIAEDVEDAVIAALNAYPSWSALSFEQRASILEAIADRIEQRAEEFAIAEALGVSLIVYVFIYFYLFSFLVYCSSPNEDSIFALQGLSYCLTKEL